MLKLFTRAVWFVIPIIICSSANAQTTIVASTPTGGSTVSGSAPDIYVDFSAPVTAPTDSIRLYRLGSSDPTPGPDDTPVPLASIAMENGSTRARLVPGASLVDGNYAVVVYGKGTTVSGPGQMMRFTNDQLSLDLAAYLNLTEFTMEGWTYWYSLPTTGSHSYGALFDIGQNARNVPGFWLSHGAGDEVRFGCVNENAVQTQIVVDDVLTVNRWYHLAATSSLTSGMKLYVDGELIGSLPTACVPANASSVYQIALSGYTRWAGAYDWADASFDEMRIWDTARSQADIQRTMHTPLVGDEPNLLVYHRLDGTTNDLIDSTGNGYTGSRNNAARIASDAPLIEMSVQSVIDQGFAHVDADGDGNPGGVYINLFGVDNTPPRITQTSIGFNGCTTTLGFTNIVVYFDDEMDAGTLIPANMSLIRSNGDGVFNDGDDVPLAISNVTYNSNDRSATLTIGSLRPDDAYELTITDQVRNAAGLSLDGDYPGEGGITDPLPSGDSVEGGDFAYQFAVDSMNDCNANGIADVCDLIDSNRVYVSPAGVSGFTFVGDGEAVDGRISLVNLEQFTTGGAWGTDKQLIGDRFEAEFTFSLNPSAAGADGLAFVIQNEGLGALGGEGLEMGYTGITSSLAVEFDTWANSGDFGDNHISVHTNGLNANSYLSGTSLGWAPAGVTLSNGATYDVYIVYQNGELNIYFNGGLTPILSVTVDIASTLGLADGRAWVGFVAATGSDFQNHDILSFCFNGPALGCTQSLDCNSDGIPDECQLDGNDCNADGIPDECQLANNDVNANNIPDDCELDCNDNQIPDELEIANCPMGDLTCADCNGDGVLDVCEIDGRAGASLRFDGTNDLVRVLDDNLLKPDALTIELWTRLDGIQPRLARLLRKAGNFQPGYLLSATTSNLDPTIHFFANEIVFDTQQHSAYLNEWHHFAGIFDDGDVRLYVDGQLVANVQTDAGPLDHSSSNLTIGGATFGSTEFIRGDIDDVRIWNYARSATEIANNYNRSINSNQPGLIAHYRFDTGSGQSIFDSTPNGLDGTIGLTANAETDDPTWLSVGVPLPGNDCNQNGVLDACEIADMSIDDCNGNGIPDECEAGGLDDCDNNGESDLCAVFNGSGDCNGDIIPDECQLLFNDCDGNGVPDECDPDCDGNMIPDACDAADCPMGDNSCADCNMNGVLDGCELFTLVADSVAEFSRVQGQDNWYYGYYVTPFTSDTFALMGQYLTSSPDFAGEAAWQVQQGSGGFFTGLTADTASPNANAPNGRQPDFHWASRRWMAEYDGATRLTGFVAKIPANAGGCGGCDGSVARIFVDGVEVWTFALAQTDGVGTTFDVPVVLNEGSIVDFAYDPNNYNGQDRAFYTIEILGTTDCNENGVLDECDIADMTVDDCNANGIPDECETVPTDDCDNDGETDLCAIANGAADCNADGIPDDCQLDQNDCNANGVPDDCDPDCDGNQIPDVCDLANCTKGDLSCADCNSNDVLDVCELAGNDCNGNGIPDECDLASCPVEDASCADCNGNGIPDSCDILTEQFALRFDNSDYVFIPNSASLSITSSLTIELWARMDNPAGGSQLLLIKGDDSSGQDPYFLRVSSNNIEFGLDGDAGATARLVASIGQYDWSVYHHIAAVFDDNADEMRLFVDGVEIGSTMTVVTPMTVQTPHYVTLGGTVGTGQAFAGDLDDIRIWSLARTEAQIQSSLGQRLNGSENGLVALWRCDEGSGQQLLDASPAGNFGRLGQNFNIFGDSRDPIYISETADLPLNDCNQNGILDDCEIAAMTASDCDADGIPDDCQPGGDSDCDNDGESDYCELLNGAADCNNDAIPDECQWDMNDCDSNGIPDDCQDDCDGNGIPDACDIANCPMGDLSCIDCNSNDVLDSCEITLVSGGALYFDGVNDLVRVLANPELEPDEITVEVWARLDGVQSRSTRLVRNGGSYVLSATTNTSGNRLANLFNGRVNAFDTQLSDAYVGEWHHFAGTAGIDGIVSFFVDGQMVSSATGDAGPLGDIFNDLYFGSGLPASDPDEYFRGELDEVRIWDYPRSQEEIADSYNRSLIGDEPGLIGHWRFDSAAGQSAIDSGPNGLNGTLGFSNSVENNDPTWVPGGAPLLVNDCNQNGILDECDIADMTADDCDANGVPDECQFGGDSDCDDDGESDFCALFNGASDCNGDLIPDECQLATDDCNDNGIVDSCEIGGPNDCNNDAIPDSCQLDGNDCNSNGILDACESGGTTDCDGNGEIDLCDLFVGAAEDCNANGILDSCDIDGGGSTDTNANDVPDDCESEVRITPVIRSTDPAGNSPMAASLPESVSSVRLGATTYVEIWASDVGMDTGGMMSAYVNIVLSGNLNVPTVFHEDDFDFFALGNPAFGGVGEFGGAYLGMDSLGVEPNWVRIGWIEFLAGPNPLSVNLTAGFNGVSTQDGNVANSFVALGSANALPSLPQISYDLTDDNFIGVNDLFDLLDAWMESVPPADALLDFDCDGVVGPGDLSWFASGWQRSATDFAIAYPPCALSNPQPLPTEADDIDIRLIPRLTASASDSATLPPSAERMLMTGQNYVVEVWINDGGLLTGGVTSAYLDIRYQGGVSVGALSTHPDLNLEATGSDDGSGTIAALGGSTIEAGFASELMWERVATINATVTGEGASFSIDPATATVAAYGRGLIDELAITNTSVTTALLGDVDLDMDVDMDDVTLFIDVVLGNDTDAVRQALSDLNGDGAANGRDIEVWLSVL